MTALSRHLRAISSDLELQAMVSKAGKSRPTSDCGATRRPPSEKFAVQYTLARLVG